MDMKVRVCSGSSSVWGAGKRKRRANAAGDGHK